MINKITVEPKADPQLDAFIPVRLCCGQRHWGAVCPDGKVMCCVCFERVSQDALCILPNGEKENVCKACDEMGNGTLKRNGMKMEKWWIKKN